LPQATSTGVYQVGENKKQPGKTPHPMFLVTSFDYQYINYNFDKSNNKITLAAPAKFILTGNQ